MLISSVSLLERRLESRTILNVTALSAIKLSRPAARREVARDSAKTSRLCSLPWKEQCKGKTRAEEKSEKSA